MEDFFSHLIAFKKVFSYTPTKKWYPSSRIEPGCEVVEVITGGRYHYGDKVFQRGTILWHIADECLLNGANRHRTALFVPFVCLSGKGEKAAVSADFHVERDTSPRNRRIFSGSAGFAGKNGYQSEFSLSLSLQPSCPADHEHGNP